MDLLLADKVVWITGASGGIGRALAAEFAAEGSLVGLHANRGAEAAEGSLVGLHANRGAEELGAWLGDQPWRERALVVTGDVSDHAAMDRCAAALVERFGRIDACVANAGVWPPEDLPLDKLPPERLRRTVEVDLLGALFTARAFLAALRASGPRADGHGAALTFVGSTAGRFGEREHVDYSAAKAGLVGALRTLKNEIVGIDPAGRVNLVEPGWTVTHMARPALEVPGTVERVTSTMPLRQLGRAADVARAIVMLSSPYASSHLTGQILTVAGGMEGRLLWGSEELDRETILGRLERD